MAVTETKTIHEFLAENPNVDVSQAWERLWGIQKGIVERVKGRFDVELHPACEGRDYYAAPDGRMEGSFAGYTGPEVDWLVNSWIGNRKASILDINATVFLSQHVRVPHLTVIFGTVPIAILTVGVILTEDKDKIVLASSIGERDFEDVGGVISIPMACVTHIDKVDIP